MISFLQCAAHEHFIMVFAKITAFMRPTTNATYALWKLAFPAERRPMVSTAFADLSSAFRTGNQKAHIVVVFAQAFNRWRHTTDAAFLQREPTFLAKVLAVCGDILLPVYFFTAILAFIHKMCILCLRSSVIMVNAKSKSKMRFAANFAKCSRPMDEIVFGVVSAQFEVLDSIIVPNLIDVMHNFFWPKQSTNLFLHQKTMFSDISPAVAIRMVWKLNADIAIMVFKLFAWFSVGSSIHKERTLQCQSSHATLN